MAEERLPADIFEEMAGVREITPDPSEVSKDNVNQEIIKTEVNEQRLLNSSVFLLKDVPEFKNYLIKITKKLLSFQKKEAPAPKKKPSIILEVFNSKKKKEKKDAGILSNLWNYFISPGIKIFKMLLRGVIKVLFTLVKWAFKILMKLGEILIKIFWKLLKLGFKILKFLLKQLSKLLFKALKLIWKGVVRLAKAFWNVLVKLFHKIKRKIKGLQLNEPKSFSFKPKNMQLPKNMVEETMDEPSLKKGGVELKKIKGKPMNTRNLNPSGSFSKSFKAKPRESFIWKIFKRVLAFFLKILKKIVGKVFGKIIEKLIGMVVKIIVRFVMLQIIGSLVPGLGNAFALAMTAISAIILIADAVGFVKDLSQSMEAPQDDNADFDEKDEEIQEASMEAIKKLPPTTHDHFNKLNELNKKELTGNIDYIYTKQDYLVGLLEQAERERNYREIKLIKDALGLKPNEDSTDTPLLDAVQNTDLHELQRKIAKMDADKFYMRKEINKKEIIGESELEELLIVGEGEPEWVVIWQRIIKYISAKVKERLDKGQYIKAAENSLKEISNHKIDKKYTLKEVLPYYNKRKVKSKNYHVNILSNALNNSLEKTKKISERRARILNGDYNIFALGIIPHFVEYNGTPTLIENVIEDNKINLFDESENLRDKCSDYNMVQTDKLTEIIKIKRVLLTKNKYKA